MNRSFTVTTYNLETNSILDVETFKSKDAEVFGTLKLDGEKRTELHVFGRTNVFTGTMRHEVEVDDGKEYQE